MIRCRNCAYWHGIWTMRGFLSEGIFRYHNGMTRERDSQRSRRR